MAAGVLLTLSQITRRRLVFAGLLVALIIAVGTTGFRLLEGFSWLDSLYAAVQTVTTVGYGDIAPLTSAGRFFSTVLMLLGVGTVLYALTVLAQAFLQSEKLEAFDNRRKLREMEKLSDHYIVCGAGRVGSRIIRDLQRQGLPHIIIERNASLMNVEPDRARFIIGDATSEENLMNAGVRRARGLAACLPDDASNVYVVLTARGLNPDLHIVARAVEEQAESTLIRAGASRVVAPTIIGSQAMARSLLKPAVADFMASIVAESLDLVFEEIAVDADSPYANTSLSETDLHAERKLMVVAVRRADGPLIFHPPPETKIDAGDLLIVIGKAEKVQELAENNTE